MGVLAGMLFIDGEASTRGMPGIDYVACASPGAYLVNAVDLLKDGLFGVALALLVRAFRVEMTTTGRIVGRVAAIGFVLTGFANGVEHCAHLESLGALYVSSLLIGLIGAMAFGVFLARSEAVPPWIGWVTAAGVLSFMLAAEQGGAVILGVACIAAGLRLRRIPFSDIHRGARTY